MSAAVAEEEEKEEEEATPPDRQAGRRWPLRPRGGIYAPGNNDHIVPYEERGRARERRQSHWAGPRSNLSFGVRLVPDIVTYK